LIVDADIGDDDKMRRLLLVAVLACACGRLGFDGVSIGSGSGSGSGSGTTHLAAEVCSTQAWPNIAATSASDVAVATTPTGATVFFVPTAGGALVGFSLDTDGNLTSAAQGTKILNGSFYASAAAYVDGALIAAIVNSSIVMVNVVQPDLSGYTQIGALDGEFVGKQALLNAGGGRFTPTSCDAGLTVNPFDSQWNAMTAELSVTTAQSTGIAATPFGSDALAVWGTTSRCYIERIMTTATGTESFQSFPCSAPRLASDQVASTSLVYEATDGVRLATITNDQLPGLTSLVAAGAKAPRALYDGTRTWISYVDSAGDVEVGFLDGGAFVSTTLSGTQPQETGYELAMIGSAPWIVAVDDSGFAGYELCAGQVAN